MISSAGMQKAYPWGCIAVVTGARKLARIGRLFGILTLQGVFCHCSKTHVTGTHTQRKCICKDKAQWLMVQLSGMA